MHGRRNHRRVQKRLPLTRSQVVAGAIRILDCEGLDALSMRRLADNLRMSTMALYNHVSNKEDLLQCVAKDLIERVDFSHHHASDWRERIRFCFRALRNACLAHPYVVRLIEIVETLPSAIFVPMEITLSALEEIGADPQEASRAYFLLTNFTLGQVSYEVHGPFSGVEPEKALRNAKLDEASFPHIERAISDGEWDFEYAFDFGISVILDGLEKRYCKRGR
jgi:AcrR family transcriptional regulator